MTVSLNQTFVFCTWHVVSLLLLWLSIQCSGNKASTWQVSMPQCPYSFPPYTPSHHTQLKLNDISVLFPVLLREYRPVHLMAALWNEPFNVF